MTLKVEELQFITRVFLEERSKYSPGIKFDLCNSILQKISTEIDTIYSLYLDKESGITTLYSGEKVVVNEELFKINEINKALIETNSSIDNLLKLVEKLKELIR